MSPLSQLASRALLALFVLAALCASAPTWAQEGLSDEAGTAGDSDAPDGTEVAAEAGAEAGLAGEAPVTAELGEPPGKRWSPRKDKSAPKFLGVAALLLLWLLARSESQRKRVGRIRRPERKTPISPNELGLAAFHAAIEADLDEYRGLFLSGPEAAKVLGTDGAEAYLNRRSLTVLEDALADLAARIPPGAHFDHAALDEDDLCLLTLKLSDQGRATLPLGSVSRVGRVLRLREPSKAT